MGRQMQQEGKISRNEKDEDSGTGAVWDRQPFSVHAEMQLTLPAEET